MMVFIKMALKVITVSHTCTSSVFGYPGDRWGSSKALYLQRRINSEDIGMAHRTLPLGSQALVYNLRTDRPVLVTVVDRGPYGAIYRGRWKIKKKAKNRGKWRGCVDLTPNAANLIEHDGWDRVGLKPL